MMLNLKEPTRLRVGSSLNLVDLVSLVGLGSLVDL